MAHTWGNWKPNEKIYTKDLQVIEDKIAKMPTQEETAKFEELENKIYLSDYSFFYKYVSLANKTFYTSLPKNNNDKYLNSGSIKTIIDCIKAPVELGEFEIVNSFYEKNFYNGDKININEILCDWGTYRTNINTRNGSIKTDSQVDSKINRNFFISKLTQTNSSGQEVEVTIAQLKNPTSLSEQQEFNVYLINPFSGEEIKASNTLKITIKHQPPASIAVTTNPTKMVYNNQDSFDPTGMVVKAYDNSGNLYETTGTPSGIVPSSQLSYSESELLAYTNSNSTVTLNVIWDTFSLSTSGPAITTQPTNPHHMAVEASNINYNDGDTILDDNHKYVGKLINSNEKLYKNLDYPNGVSNVPLIANMSKAELIDSTIDYGEYEQQTLSLYCWWNDQQYIADIAINVYKVIPKFSDLTVEELSDIINKYKIGSITKEQLQHWTTNLADTKRIDISSNEYFDTVLDLSVAAIKDADSSPNYIVGNNEKYMIISMSVNVNNIKDFHDPSGATYHWEDSYIRERLNIDLYQALPDGYKALFKKFKHYIYDWWGGYGGFIEDTFSLFSMGEVNGRDGDCNSKRLITSRGGFGPERANQDPELRSYLERSTFYARTLTKYSDTKCYAFYFSGGRNEYEESLWDPMSGLSFNIGFSFYGVM